MTTKTKKIEKSQVGVIDLENPYRGLTVGDRVRLDLRPLNGRHETGDIGTVALAKCGLLGVSFEVDEERYEKGIKEAAKLGRPVATGSTVTLLEGGMYILFLVSKLGEGITFEEQEENDAFWGLQRKRYSRPKGESAAWASKLKKRRPPRVRRSSLEDPVEDLVETSEMKDDNIDFKSTEKKE